MAQPATKLESKRMTAVAVHLVERINVAGMSQEVVQAKDVISIDAEEDPRGVRLYEEKRVRLIPWKNIRCVAYE